MLSTAATPSRTTTPSIVMAVETTTLRWRAARLERERKAPWRKTLAMIVLLHRVREPSEPTIGCEPVMTLLRFDGTTLLLFLRTLQSPVMRAAFALVLFALTSTASAQGWMQWGRNGSHESAAPTPGQSMDRVETVIQTDPFVDFEKELAGGALLTHYK